MLAERAQLPWLLGGLVATVAVTAGVLSLGQAFLVPALWVAIPIVCWLLNRKVFNTPYLSPTTIVAGIFLAIGAFGYMLRGVVGRAGVSGASIIIDLTEDQALQTLKLISVASTLIVLSSGIVLRILRPRTNLPAPAAEPKASKVISPGLILMFSAVPLLAVIADVGLDDLIERDYYIVGDRGSFIGSVGSLLATAAVLVVGYAFASSHLGGRLAALILLFAYTALMLSYGSRRLAMIPILFAIGSFIARDTRASRWGIAIAGVLSFVLLPLPLEFRSNATHGIAPYLHTFSTFTLGDVDWASALNNILVAFPIIGASAYGNHPVYFSDILISLNPIPGGDAGWYSIYQRLRLNFYTPMSGIGELGHVGWSVVVPFFLALGLAMAWMERLVRKQLQAGSKIYVGVIIALAALFALQMIQYNLRASTRVLVYLIVAELARQVLMVIWRSVKKEPRIDQVEQRLRWQLAQQARRAGAPRA